MAETTSGRMIAAEAAAALDRGGAGGGGGAEEDLVPEDVGQRAAHLLLEEVSRGGVVDSSHQVGRGGAPSGSGETHPVSCLVTRNGCHESPAVRARLLGAVQRALRGGCHAR